MNNDTENPLSHVDRKTAAKLNPFIGIWTSETLDNVADFIDALEVVYVGCAHSPVVLGHDRLNSVLQTIRVALEYEARNPRLTPKENEAQEPPVKLVADGR